jgi:hypothetical protein
MTEMIKVSYKNLYGRGFLTKKEYQNKLRMYRPDEFMEVPKEEYEAKMGKIVEATPKFIEKKKKEKGVFD